jgi:hypothetical protein
MHIGPKKTGSTALQRCLDENREELSTLYKICYPIPLFGGQAHHELVYAINYQLNGTAPYAEALGITNIPHPSEIIKGYLKQATDSDCQTMILSSETLFELDEKQHELLQMSTEGIGEIEYVFGLRDRISLIASRWQEEVKHGYTKTLLEYINTNSGRIPNTRDYFQKIVDIPAKSSNKKLRVKPFLYSGYSDEQNIFQEFLYSVSLSFVNLNQQPKEVNESIKSGPLIALMTANHWIDSQSSLVKDTNQEAWLQPIKRALDLREFVLKNTPLEELNYSLTSFFCLGDNETDPTGELNELVNFTLSDFQLVFPPANHDRYEQKLRKNINETMTEIFEINLSDFRSHVEKYKAIGLRLAKEYADQI